MRLRGRGEDIIFQKDVDNYEITHKTSLIFIRVQYLTLSYSSLLFVHKAGAQGDPVYLEPIFDIVSFNPNSHAHSSEREG